MLQLSWFTAPLIPDPRRRWWACVAGYALLLLTWFFFARVTTLLMQEPRGAPVPESALTWTDSDWRFGTTELRSGLVQHYLFDGTERVILCRDTTLSCRKMLFPQTQACTEMTDSRIGDLQDAQAKCNQLAGRMRFNGHFIVGHLQGIGSVVRRAGTRNPQLLFSQRLVRPQPKERNLVLLTMAMLAMTLACLYGLLRLAIPRMMLAWAQYRGLLLATASAPAHEQARAKQRRTSPSGSAFG